MRGNLAATALILIGVVALGINLELFEIDFVRLARTWWPLVLIALGVGLFLTPGERNRPD
jgi:hypothetical protein